MSRAIEVACVLFSVAMLADWLGHRERRRGYLALAFGSLTFLVVLAPSLSQDGTYGPLLTDVGVLLFLFSGWALLMFRDSFIAFGSRTRAWGAVVLLLVAALAVVARLPADAPQPPGPLQTIALVAILTTWGLCVAEPIVTFWSASRGRPAVEGARMRALSLGYAGIVVVIMFGTLGGAFVQNDEAQLALDLVALAIFPMLCFNFYPPTSLRRMWSQPEEEELPHALHSLLAFSPDRATQAQPALEWATRLLGDAGALIVDSNLSILASRGLSETRATEVAVAVAANATGGEVRSPRRGPTTLVIPLDFQQGPGAMVIVAGPFTPLFGDEEVTRLPPFASSIAAALDRVTLTPPLHALTKAKTEFMNIASPR